jgi:quinolinate synthase
MLRIQSPLSEGYTGADPDDLAQRIGAAKAALGNRLFILGHHYQRDEVMRWADARGDSFRLSVLAQQRADAEFIVSVVCISWPSRPTCSPATTSR